jgi:hypothetical protein
MNMYTNIHNVTKIEVQEINQLDSKTAYSRHIVVHTHDGGRYELTVFGKKESDIIVKEE